MQILIKKNTGCPRLHSATYTAGLGHSNLSLDIRTRPPVPNRGSTRPGPGHQGVRVRACHAHWQYPDGHTLVPRTQQKLSSVLLMQVNSLSQSLLLMHVNSNFTEIGGLAQPWYRCSMRTKLSHISLPLVFESQVTRAFLL